MADEQRDEAPEQGDEPDDESRQTEDNDGRLTAEQVEDAVYTALRKVRIEEQTERLELRAEGDVGDQDVLEFAASHFDGMGVADFTAVVDDEDQGTVMDALDDLQSNEANQDDDEDDEDDEEDEMSADDEPEDADGGLDEDERTVDPDDANDSAGKTIDTADEDDETTEDNDGPEPRDEAYFSGP